MTASLLQKTVDNALRPDDLTDILELAARHPYLYLPAATYLKLYGDSIDQSVRERLTRLVALAGSDPSKIYMLLDKDGASHATFYPPQEPRTISTENAIDKFLDTYGSTSPEEEELLNRLIFNPVPDYAQILAEEEQKSLPDISKPSGDEEQDRINTFIVKQKQAAGQAPGGVKSEEQTKHIAERFEEEPKEIPPMPDDSLMSESLAKIFIKQRHYQRAYEIISQLSLNYPEKNVYFADQLRFLRKLIINSNYKKTE